MQTKSKNEIPFSHRAKVYFRRLFSNKSKGNRKKTGDLLVFLIIACIALFSVIPLVMSIGMSLKPLNELFYFPPTIWPENITFSSFSMLFTLMNTTWVPFSRYVFNTVFITLTSTIGHLFVASMAAYPLAKTQFPGKKVMNTAVMYSLMFVSAVNDVANYLTMSFLGWIDTYWAVIIPFLGQTLGVFMMRNYISGSVPDALLESAKIDGCSEMGIYWKIVMPLVKPIWLTVGILMFQQVWGQAHTLYIYREELKTLPYAISQIVSGGLIRQGAAQAGAVLMLIVPAIVFLISQSKIIGAMATSGLKE